MRVDVALCQYMPVPGDPEANAGRIERALRKGPGDVLMFPEMFLTGYGHPCEGLQERSEQCIGEISDLCRMLDKAVAVGAPRFESDLVYNSMAFLSPDGDSWYDKVHLASFGVYAETGFAPGYAPAMGSYHGMLFGMCICYDIFFPEILHGCSLNGASVNICSAASAMQSKPFLDRVLPARALEDVTYTAYINNVGPMNGRTPWPSAGRRRGPWRSRSTRTDSMRPARFAAICRTSGRTWTGACRDTGAGDEDQPKVLIR